MCSGTIIDNNWVLSAAHCCLGRETPAPTATFGEGRLNVVDPGQFKLESNAMFIHPEYLNGTDGSFENSDLCLIKFDNDILSMVGYYEN